MVAPLETLKAFQNARDQFSRELNNALSNRRFEPDEVDRLDRAADQLIKLLNQWMQDAAPRLKAADRNLAVEGVRAAFRQLAQVVWANEPRAQYNVLGDVFHRVMTASTEFDRAYPLPPETAAPKT